LKEHFMKCISLHQPWATLVILGIKQFETRSWRTAHRGPLGIHAARRFPQVARGQCGLEPFRSALQRAGFKHSADLPRGVLLGTVELIDCLPAPAVLERMADDDPQRLFGDYRRRRWAWQLETPLAFSIPRVLTGRLGVYEIPDLTLFRGDAPAANESLFLGCP